MLIYEQQDTIRCFSEYVIQKKPDPHTAVGGLQQCVQHYTARRVVLHKEILQINVLLGFLQHAQASSERIHSLTQREESGFIAVNVSPACNQSAEMCVADRHCLCCSYRIDTTSNVLVFSPVCTTTSSSIRFDRNALASGESMLIADVFASASSAPTMR